MSLSLRTNLKETRDLNVGGSTKTQKVTVLGSEGFVQYSERVFTIQAGAPMRVIVGA